MKNVLAAVRLLLGDLAQLHLVTKATAIATVVVPVVLAVSGVKLTVAEVTGWLVLAGGIAAALQNLLSGRAAAVKKQ